MLNKFLAFALKQDAQYAIGFMLGVREKHGVDCLRPSVLFLPEHTDICSQEAVGRFLCNRHAVHICVYSSTYSVLHTLSTSV